MTLNNIINVIIILLAFSCTTIHYTDKELAPYVDNYFKLLKNNCINNNFYYPSRTIIRFKNLPYPIIGYCNKFLSGFSVDIDKEFWNRALPIEKEELISHELGHCILGLEHSDDPNNYMYKSIGLLERNSLYNQVISDMVRECEESK